MSSAEKADSGDKGNGPPIPGGEVTEGVKQLLEGFEGRNVSFQCSHKIASNSNKYFCKDPCKGEGEKLVTVEPSRRAESGRIALVDSGDGSFTVTFSHLQLSDSQKYWCAVDRLGLDTYTEVQLAVKKGVPCNGPGFPETGGSGDGLQGSQ
uniref:Immunoglobulin domain-containing protein n=1 Tax=Neolamprologus brichardi TaxID=32507 RepID=A0A3Q4M3Y9_NEOBR